MSLFNKIKDKINDSDKLLIELVCSYLENNKSNIDIYNELKEIYNNPSLINDVVTIINAIKKNGNYTDKHSKYIELLNLNT